MTSGRVPDSSSDEASESGTNGGVVRYDERLRDSVAAFQRLAYPLRRRSLIAPRWNWMFLVSAARLGERPAVWVYRDSAGVHAQRGAILVRLQCGPEEIVAGWLVDTVVLPHRRGRGIGDMIVAEATHALPVGLSLGQTGHIRALQDRHGWQPVASMRSWLLVVRPAQAFRGRVPNEVLRAGAARAARAWRLGCEVLLARTPSGDVRVVDRFDEGHDRLWDRVRQRFGCLVVRDASYLNWKYVDQPGVSPRRLSLVDSAGVVKGVCVWVRHAPHDTHAYVRGWVLDLVVDPQARADVFALLAAVARDAQQEGVDVLELDLHASALEPYLRRTGWIRGGVTRHLRVAAHDIPGDLMTRLADPGTWFLTRGDSDGDHPWWTPDGREPEASAP